MKYRIICPVCKERISGRGFFQKRAKCKACGAMLRKNAKWESITLIIALLIVLLLLYLALSNAINWLIALGIILLMYVLDILLDPYLIKYEVDPKRDGSKNIETM
jgi:uncharacterized protein (DUF983 family)